MIDHISVRAQDFSKIIEFYRAALGPVGYRVVMEYPGAAGMAGSNGMPDLWIMQSDKPINPTHIAISGLRSEVDQFYAAALAAGGTDNGPPGMRPDYHEHYYAAFVRDPEGNNIEVVCHYPNGVKPAPPAPGAKKSAAKKAVKSSAKESAKKSPKKSAKAAARKPAAQKAAAKAAPKAKAKAKNKKRR
ncbi:MAG TPA: VOC family protein [Polyangia bacterium]|jgi:catechol 2,3-dioxygenase-like lactoylglutathione lyase family enzyme|nr:VOC family protein [Polyangia bacterium]